MKPLSPASFLGRWDYLDVYLCLYCLYMTYILCFTVITQKVVGSVMTATNFFLKPINTNQLVLIDFHASRTHFFQIQFFFLKNNIKIFFKSTRVFVSPKVLYFNSLKYYTSFFTWLKYSLIIFLQLIII